MSTRSERAVGAGAPARRLVLVTKADADQAVPLQALRVAVAEADAPATLAVVPLDGGDAITLNYPVAGIYWEPIGVRRVSTTGSTANAVVHGVPLLASTE